MNASDLRTPRLTLVPASARHVAAELAGASAFGALLGYAGTGWYGWYAIRGADAEAPVTLVAGCGYFGPPSPEGEVELGYSVCPEWRGRGYATEIVSALAAQALRHTSVGRVIAHTTAANVASVRVLERSGFALAGPGREHGTLRYEHARPPAMADQ